MADADGPIFSEAQWAELAEVMSLSPRQVDVVRCLFAGCADKQIAQQLGLSVNTVRDYMGRLFLKLAVADRVELILCVLARFLDGCRRDGCPRMRGH